MERIKQPLSIKIIYWLTNVVFWLFSIAGVIGLFFSIGMISGLLHDMQLNVGVPVEMNVLEKGTLDFDFYAKYIQVEFLENYGTIHFVDTPLIIARFYGVFTIIVLSLTYFILWEFRSFINNIYKGYYFKYFNINHLKRISYALVGVWVFTVFYGYFQYFFIVKNLNFETIEFNLHVNTYPSILGVALFIWVLSHIFMKGLEIESENQLTI